jgi:hypothetical protein
MWSLAHALELENVRKGHRAGPRLRAARDRRLEGAWPYGPAHAMLRVA